MRSKFSLNRAASEKTGNTVEERRKSKKDLRGNKRCPKPVSNKSDSGGMKIQVSFIVVAMAAVAITFGYTREVLSYGAAVILHEFAHATVAARFGFTLNTLKIMPYGAALTGEFDNAGAREELLIAAAGPLSNVLFAIAFVAVWWLVPSLFYYTEIYVAANVFTALINMLPVFPLDGGRVALALLSVKFPRKKAYGVLRVAGFIVSAILAIGAIFAYKYLNFSYFTFFMFILISSALPDKKSKYQRLYTMSYRMEKIRSGLSVKQIMVHRDTTLLKCTRLLGVNCYTRFIITDDNLNVLGEISETELEDLMTRKLSSETIFEAIHRK